MATVFIAVQCFQCSTMQVKQQRKNGNKWTCVVCNHKQSIRKVFAKGPMAKDLRLFVQSFNMSRNFKSNQHSPVKRDSRLFNNPGKRPTDWSEYLDVEEDNVIQHEEEGDEMGPKVVTELPQQMFKRPKLKNCVPGSSSGDGGSLYKPVFPKKGNTNKGVMSKGKPMESLPANVNSISKWSGCIFRDKGTRDSSLLSANKASRWNEYISQDDDVLTHGNRKSFADDLDQRSSNAWETILDDQNVEEVIHPDYM